MTRIFVDISVFFKRSASNNATFLCNMSSLLALPQLPFLIQYLDHTGLKGIRNARLRQGYRWGIPVDSVLVEYHRKALERSCPAVIVSLNRCLYSEVVSPGERRFLLESVAKQAVFVMQRCWSIISSNDNANNIQSSIARQTFPPGYTKFPLIQTKFCAIKESKQTLGGEIQLKQLS